MPTIGKFPSGPLAGTGGKPTLTSMGAPSKVVKVPAQYRSPALTPVCTMQAMPPPAPSGMLEIAAWAPGAVESAPRATTSASVLLMIPSVGRCSTVIDGTAIGRSELGKGTAGFPRPNAGESPARDWVARSRRGRMGAPLRGREEGERPDFDALPHGSIRRRARVVERAVGREARASRRRIVALEEHRLVGRHAREVEPAVEGAPAKRVDLAGPIAIAEVGRDEVLGADGAGVAHRERRLLDRTADRLPDVDDGESTLEQPLGLVAEQITDALWARALRVVVVGVTHGVLRAALSLLDPR